MLVVPLTLHSECEANPALTCLIIAVIGSVGRSSLCTCIDLSVVPSGIVPVVGLSAGVTLLAITSTTRK